MSSCNSSAFSCPFVITFVSTYFLCDLSRALQSLRGKPGVGKDVMTTACEAARWVRSCNSAGSYSDDMWKASKRLDGLRVLVPNWQ